MKTNIGKKRNILSVSISITCIVFIISFLSILWSLFIGPQSILLLPLVIITVIMLYEGYIRYSNTYYIRKIKDDEWEKLLAKKLVHYTNYISDKNYKGFLQTGMIQLNGTSKAKSNYVMKFRDKQRPYVWFHTENPFNQGEPELQSFLFSHMFESKPRKYKVIIEPADLNREKVYIRPNNGNVIYSGDLNVKARIDTSFNWYNDKLYLNTIIWPSIVSSISITTYLSASHQALGILMDKAAARKK
ncbi:hypothetical protein [Mesobacillus zeae]|uniref:hypothetical protein n=1 Tax=Mesobacillus zeae TaxID=1917180 RepID=UPI00300AE056